MCSLFLENIIYHDMHSNTFCIVINSSVAAILFDRVDTSFLLATGWFPISANDYVSPLCLLYYPSPSADFLWLFKQKALLLTSTLQHLVFLLCLSWSYNIKHLTFLCSFYSPAPFCYHSLVFPWLFRPSHESITVCIFLVAHSTSFSCTSCLRSVYHLPHHWHSLAGPACSAPYLPEIN